MIDKREITPELLARFTALLFSTISPQEVLDGGEGKVQFNRLRCKYVAEQMMKDDDFRKSFSEQNCEWYAQSVMNYVSQKTDWENGVSGQEDNTLYSEYLNLFDLLRLTLKDLLVMNQNHFCYRYEEIFSWRHLIRFIGEELPISARYAIWDLEHANSEKYRSSIADFRWPYVTEHNNKQLNMILYRGLSDHHCHLWASTPYFHASWINLMNDVTNPDYESRLWQLYRQHQKDERVDECKRGEEDNDPKPDSVLVERLRAAWIRLYLGKKLSSEEPPEVNDTDYKNVCKYLDWRQLQLMCGRLQSELDSISMLGNAIPDYLLNLAQLKKPANHSAYDILAGERWLYYKVFEDYSQRPQNRKLSDNDYNLFLAYFLIRLKLRNSMVQNNDFIGFDNFQRIERRKGLFLADGESEKRVISLAVGEALLKSPLQELEVRISPYTQEIKRLDEMIEESFGELFKGKGDPEQALMNPKRFYYYVFHFLKRPEKLVRNPASFRRTGIICRHDILRQEVVRQAERFAQFRENDPEHARRVLGIDAASKEIGCRPEVFGTAFRMLGEHRVSYGQFGEEKKFLPMLGKTYHVAEDFFDIVDGLRAIDEAVHFLNLDCGDRLGHCIALGEDVEAWYAKKGHIIAISVQDYLDNLAWLYHALVHFSIPCSSALLERINGDFEYWFRVVYRNNLTDEQMVDIFSRGAEHFSKNHEDHNLYHQHIPQFGIMAYYRSWALRGDDPSCYRKGYFIMPSGYANLIPEERCKVNKLFPNHFDDRYIAEYSLLNFLYQFNDRVHQEGDRKIKVDISDEFICAVKAVQIEMRYSLCKKGIQIETNPTSNAMIGSFRNYEKHPIFALYNRGLSAHECDEEECPQMQVSVNTDNCGTFHTNLQTEYSLLARSLELEKDEHSKDRYKKADIYAWIDRVREMSNDQTFRTPDVETLLPPDERVVKFADWSYR